MIRQKKDTHIDLRPGTYITIETEHHKEIDRFTLKLPFFVFILVDPNPFTLLIY